MLSLKSEQHLNYLPYFNKKLKLGHNFSQFNHRFKISFLSVGLRLYFQVFSKSTKINFEIFEMLLYLDFPFFPIHEKYGKLGFFDCKPRLHFQIFPKFFPNSKCWKIGLSEVPFISYFVRFQYVCKRERVTQFINKLPVFKKKKYLYLYNKFVSV